MRTFILLAFIAFSSQEADSQLKRLVVIGSSTAAGSGASPYDSCWVRRINFQYKYQQAVVDTVHNLAWPGYDNYHGMPSSYPPAFGNSNPDPERNITKANSFTPNVIIVSFVSNKFDQMPMDSIMKTLQVIKDSANIEDRVCFISTSQPRGSFDDAGRARLRVVKDSILNRFGFYAINFFDSLVNNVDNTILPQYAYIGDNIHINNAGHYMLYKQVLAKDIFNIKVTRTRKSGNFNDRATWDKGIIPTPADSIAVLPGHTLTFTNSTQVRGLSIATGGLVVINNPAVQVQIGDPTLCNKNVIVNGTMNISDGRLLIYGYIQQQAGSNFNMSGGELVIDGNNGTASTSVADGIHLFDIANGVNSFSFTGGTLQIIDPPLGTNSQALNCPTFNFGDNSILKFGNGISITASNNINGFGGSLLPAQIGSLIMDAATTGNNRIFKNLTPLDVKTNLQLLSGNLVQSALLNVRQ